METVDKILCCDKGNNSDPMAMAAMMNGGLNNQWNNPFIYLVWMMFARRMWGNDENKVQDAEIQSQLNAIRTQMADNQNSNLLMDAIKGNNIAIDQLAGNLNCDFNTLNSAICDVRGGIDRLSGQVGFSAERVINAVNTGNLNLIQNLKDCCCQTQQNIIKMGYENQLGQKDIQYATQRGFCDLTANMQRGFDYTNTGLERGFSNVAYETQRQTCDIVNAGNANTQRIIDTLHNHWQDETALKLQDAKFEISQLKQNQYIAQILNGGCACGANNQ